MLKFLKRKNSHSSDHHSENSHHPHSPSHSHDSFTPVQELRDHARENIRQGAVTSQYQGDRQRSIEILNEALATEIVCFLRYRAHYYASEGIHSRSISAEFLEHSQEEQEHADRLAERIKQLDGKPDFNPRTLLERSHAEFKEGDTLIQMIEENLIAERIAIDSYREMIFYFHDTDPTSKKLMEDILAKEEEHAEELSTLLLSLDPSRKPTQAA